MEVEDDDDMPPLEELETEDVPTAVESDEEEVEEEIYEKEEGTSINCTSTKVAKIILP